MCCLLVSGFLTEITQQIHSLRASGVISSHFASAAGSEMRTFRKSGGTVCTAPWEIDFVVMDFSLHPTERLLQESSPFNNLLLPRSVGALSYTLNRDKNGNRHVAGQKATVTGKLNGGQYRYRFDCRSLGTDQIGVGRGNGLADQYGEGRILTVEQSDVRVAASLLL
jgi:hypothetical protein